MKEFPNPPQQKAIEHLHGPMLVVAGAGTGKTSVIAARFARLVAQRQARLDEVVALTYTDAATAHLRKKVSEHLALCGIVADPEHLNVVTFHSLCLRILQRAGKDFRVLDEQDHWIYLRRRLEGLPLKHYLPARDPSEFLDSLLHFFSRCQDELVDPSKYRDYVGRFAEGQCPMPRVLPAKKDAALSPDDKLERSREIAAVFAAVEAMLAADRLGTYGHMISGAVQILRESPEILRQEQARARFILIDEFQDANVAQIELARCLAGDGRNVFGVGDPDQAIYRFRGASSAAFQEFLKRFPGTKGVVLDENQRSTSHILHCAHEVIRVNPGVDFPDVDFTRHELLSARERRAAATGAALRPAAVEIVLNSGKEQEASEIAKTLREMRDAGFQGEIAVLFRQHKHGDELVRELLAESVPFVVQGIDGFETAEVRDLRAALAAVASLSNSEELFRVSALSTFAVDAAAVREQLASAGRDASYATLLARVPGGTRVIAAVEASRAFAAGVNWQAAPVCDFVLRQFGFSLASPPVTAFRDFVAAWHKRPVTRTGELQEFIEYLDLFRDALGALPLPAPPAQPGAVQLMTAHAAKGLEFDRVFVLRVGTNAFPRKYDEDIFEFPPALREMPADDDAKALHEEEERRLFYVAMTRAKDYLAIHAHRGRGKKDDSPPGYLRELMKARDCKPSWLRRDARAYTATIHAATPASGVGAWLLMPPSVRLAGRPLSATTIDAYAACPLKFKLLADWEIPGPASAAMQFGNIVHAVLRDYHQAEQAARARSEGDVLQLFQRLMAEEQFEDPLQARLYTEQGVRQLSAYVRLRSQQPRFPIFQVEKRFKVSMAGVAVAGRIDRVDHRDDGAVRIIDFKTGNPYSQEKADRSLQLTLYAMAARELWQVDPRELLIYNLQDNSEVVTSRTEADFAKAGEKVTEVAAGIAAGDFEPTPDLLTCRWCEFRNLCPATEQNLYTIAAAAAATCWR